MENDIQFESKSEDVEASRYIDVFARVMRYSNNVLFVTSVIKLDN